MAVSKKQKTAIGGVIGAILIAVLGYLGINGLGTPNQFTSPTGQLLTTENLLNNITGQNQTVYVTKSGDKYHLEGCRHLRFRSKIPISIANAVEEGYEPCKTCKPNEQVTYIPQETYPQPTTTPPQSKKPAESRKKTPEPIMEDPD
ncbi:MAG: hypothetical protein KBA54_00350 [Candidatus Cloacimonetes bacterium]|nr:hypothetical protein [Candidatus Cloacimonadota bacterium]